MRAVFIIPYYGEFPNYFNLFLKTCSNNPSYDWLIFSDIKWKYEMPSNVRRIEMSFEMLRDMIQEKMGFVISLNTPYKLCDFKPAYGYVFQNYISKYDYWGYCDIDMLLGNLEHFIPYEKICLFDKIGHLGHLALYRNDSEINHLFAAELDGNIRYREVFTADRVYVFDEWNWISINHIFLAHSKKVWMFNDFYDIYPYDDNLIRVSREIPEGNSSYGKETFGDPISFAIIENGNAFQLRKKHGAWIKDEVAYVHFQKRNMQVELKEDDSDILCVSDRFVSMDDKILKKNVNKAIVHRVFNKKRFRWIAKRIIYGIIEKTGTIRHPFRNKTKER